MKKLAVIIMIFAAMFVFAACGGSTEMSNEEKSEAITAQLDYEYLEQLFHYLPVYNAEDPVTDKEMEDLIQYSMLYRYINHDLGNEDMPTPVREDEVTEFAGPDTSEQNLEKTGFYTYIRVPGTQFDKLADQICFDKARIKEILSDNGEYAMIKWDEDTIVCMTDGLGGFFTEWDVKVGETRAVEGKVEVDYDLTLTDYMTEPMKVITSTRTAVFELTDEGYVITEVRADDIQGVYSISELNSNL